MCETTSTWLWFRGILTKGVRQPPKTLRWPCRFMMRTARSSRYDRGMLTYCFGIFLCSQHSGHECCNQVVSQTDCDITQLTLASHCSALRLTDQVSYKEEWYTGKLYAFAACQDLQVVILLLCGWWRSLKFGSLPWKSAVVRASNKLRHVDRQRGQHNDMWNQHFSSGIINYLC